jgi:hypothetical protein
MSDAIGSRVGSKAPNASKQTRQTLQALTRYGPDYLKTIQGMSEELTPRQNKLDYDQYSQFAPLFSKLGAEDQVRGISNDNAAINSGGRELANQAFKLEREASPEWAASMGTANRGYQDLIGGMDPNKLSGAEMANTERGVNRLNARTGNLNVGDSTTTAANAMTFGGALDQKRQNFSNALNLFPGIASQSRSNVDGFSIATGKGNQNTGLNQYKNPSSQFSQQGSQLGAQISGGQQAGQAQNMSRKTVDQSSHDAMGSCMGCYIFKEVYGFPDAPDYIRWCRDFYYQKDKSIAKGYRKMSYWLVPMMQKNKLIKFLATYCIVFPLAGYGQYLTGYKTWTKVFKPVAKFWLKVWNMTGK